MCVCVFTDLKDHSFYNVLIFVRLIMLGFKDISTLEGQFVSSPREREKRNRKGDEREGQGRKRIRTESEKADEIKTFPLYPYLLQG